MTQKYYTPTIDEFYVGFEYKEFNIKNQSWDEKVLVDIYENHEFDILLDPGDQQDGFRVKFLDKEDIESLGWILKGNLLFCIGDWWLSFYQDTMTMDLSGSVDRDNDQFNWFNIKCKNKSELKKLMQMLNIK